MLSGTMIRARRIAPATYLIERVTRQPVVAKPASPVAAAPPAIEQAPPPEEIVVTATKRDIPIGSYPGGVQIVEGSELSAAESLRGTEAIEARVASVASTHLGPGRNKLFIRGIADSSFVGPTQATVGQYWGNSRITYSAPDPKPAALRCAQRRSARRAAGHALRRRIAGRRRARRAARARSSHLRGFGMGRGARGPARQAGRRWRRDPQHPDRKT
jgi:hypothetical protein